MMKTLAAYTSSIAVCCALAAAPTNSSALKAPGALPGVDNAVRHLQPRLSKKDALALVRALRKVSSDPRCGIPWQILLSIAFNESSLIKHEVNVRTKDYGLMQINEKTARQLGLNVARLMVDEQYALQAGCQVLRENRERFAHKFPAWLGLYRSGTAIWKYETRKSAEAYVRALANTASKFGHRQIVMKQ